MPELHSFQNGKKSFLFQMENNFELIGENRLWSLIKENIRRNPKITELQKTHRQSQFCLFIYESVAGISVFIVLKLSH